MSQFEIRYEGGPADGQSDTVVTQAADDSQPPLVQIFSLNADTNLGREVSYLRDHHDEKAGQWVYRPRPEEARTPDTTL